eukprot:scaffold1525_cov142-Cylindrotheca_fusiformis.AAC.52
MAFLPKTPRNKDFGFAASGVILNARNEASTTKLRFLGRPTDTGMRVMELYPTTLFPYTLQEELA